MATTTPTALDIVVEAARRRLADIGQQASKYERLADEERVRCYGNAKAGATNGRQPFQTGHDKIAAETMREHYRPLKEAIDAVIADRDE